MHSARALCIFCNTIYSRIVNLKLAETKFYEPPAIRLVRWVHYRSVNEPSNNVETVQLIPLFLSVSGDAKTTLNK